MILSDMNNKAYRINMTQAIYLMVIACLFIMSSCEEDNQIVYTDPSIHFVENSEYISSDTMLKVGQKFQIGIYAESNGSHKLTNFIAKVNDERYIDLGIYKDVYERELEITKSLEDIEKWEFIIRDIHGNSASIYLTIKKDPHVIYGEIDEFLNIKLGAQLNTQTGSFFSLSTGQVYPLEQAYHNQENIDILYYYDDFDKLEENIIASPGANLTGVYSGEYDVSNWDIKNTTRYSREKLDITTEEFDDAVSDSILIANSFAFENGGRKSKFLEPGDIYSFVRENRTGMFRVVSTSGTTEGSIVVDIKIQK